MNRRQLTVNAAAAAVQVVVTGIAYIFLYRFLLDSLGEMEFGVWALVLALSSASNVANLGLASACVPFVAKALAADDQPEAAKIVTTAVTTVGGFLLVTLVAGYPLIRALLPMLADNAEAVEEGIRVLPFSLASFWCSSVATVFLSSLEGAQRMDRRSHLLIAAIIVYLSGALLLVPKFGLMGVAYAHLLHTLTLLVFSWVLLRRHIPILPLLPHGWNTAAFKRIYRYGAGMQISAIAQVLTEPTAKALVSAFGGLGVLTYYEFASRMAVQFRAVIASAHRAVVPAIAHLTVTDSGIARSVFVRSHRLLQVLVAATLPLLLALLPQISAVWIGRVEPFFVFCGAFLSAAWFLNLLSNPAYFGFLGEGRARWPTVSHGTQALGNVALGLILGNLMGVRGVVVGFAIALVVASTLVSTIYRRRQQVAWSELISRDSVLFPFWTIASGFGVFILLRVLPIASDVLALALGTVVYGALVTIPALRHPAWRDLTTWFKVHRQGI